VDNFDQEISANPGSLYLLSGRQMKLGLLYNAIEILVLRQNKSIEEREKLIERLKNYITFSDALLRPSFSHYHMHMMYI
jgi:hypothetical protein